MEGKPIRITIGKTTHRIQPLPRKLICGGRSLTLPEVLNRQGGLIIGEGDTGKSTYVQMLYEKAKAHDKREPILVKLRNRPPKLEVPDVPEGEVQTIIWDGLDEYPERAPDILDLTDDLDPERYHVWVTSRPCSAASIVAGSRLLELVHHLAPFTHADVCEIARLVKLDGEAFISRVHEAQLESFIIKPGGVIILMQLFGNGKLEAFDQSAHSMNTGMMEIIMHDFALETRDGDVSAAPKLVCSEKKIVEAACWIAACLVFSGRDAIGIGEKANCPANDLHIDDLPPREFGTKLFEAVLGLRLFEPLSPTRYRLAYSEMPPFLAGCWLVKDFPVEKLKELPLYPASMAARSMPLEAIAWASAYNTAFSKPFFLKYPSKFLKFHALIEETGFNKFFSALCRENIYLYDDSDDDDSVSSDWYSLIDESDFAGCTEFAKMLQNALDSNQYSFPDKEYIRAFLAACESEPHYSYRLPSLERDDDGDIYSDTPLSPAELDALAPSKEKPVNEMVSVVPEGFVDKVVEAVAKKTKNKGGRPKKDACRRCISVETAAELIGCHKSMLENWERYEKTDGETGCAPIEIEYKKNGITKQVKYTVKLRENFNPTSARIFRAIKEALKSAEAGDKIAAEKKIFRITTGEKLYRMQNPDGIVSTQNPDDTY